MVGACRRGLEPLHALHLRAHVGGIGFGQASDMAAFKPTPRVSAIIDNWAPYYVKRVGEVLDGTWTSSATWAGIGEGEVEIGEITDAVPAEVKAEAEALRDQIGSGAYHPFTGPLKKADGTRQKAEFTITGGMCVRCEGRGSVSDFDIDALVDPAARDDDRGLVVEGVCRSGNVLGPAPRGRGRVGCPARVVEVGEDREVHHPEGLVGAVRLPRTAPPRRSCCPTSTAAAPAATCRWRRTAAACC